MNYFSQKCTFFLILQLWLALFFNISSLSDLKYNLHKYREKSDFFGKNRIFSGKIGFFRENIGFFPKNRRFLPIFFRFFCRRFFHPKIFSTTTENRFFAEKSAEKIDFFVLETNQVTLIQFLKYLNLTQFN